MAARSTPEWIGKTPDSAIPPRVKLRILEAQKNACATCRTEFCAHVRPQFDHTIALINGGENREGNLQAICDHCHKPKTVKDVAMKAKDRRVKAKHLGIAPKKQKIGGGLASRFKRKVDGTVVPR